MKFAIFGNTRQTQKAAHAAALFDILRAKGADLHICGEYYRFLETFMKPALTGLHPFENKYLEADMVISIGGDGTFLKAASMTGQKNVPILGINTGRLGFLADTVPAEMEAVIDDIYNQRYTVEDRSMLELKCNTKIPRDFPYALNEIAILKRDTSSMITIHVTVNGEYLTAYLADGLVIATPTGSTAYSLSIGGPVIVPQSKTIAITPVAPHSLNIRPIVICDEWEIALQVESRSHTFLVAVDGRNETCKESTRLTIRQAAHTVKVVKHAGHSFFNTLRTKMLWGMDSRH